MEFNSVLVSSSTDGFHSNHPNVTLPLSSTDLLIQEVQQFASSLEVEDDLEDQVTVFIHLRSSSESSSLKEWLDTIHIDASKQDGWMGRILLDYLCGEKKEVDWIVAFRFKTHQTLTRWIESDVRRKHVVKLQSLKHVSQLSTDIVGGNVTFFPERMGCVARSALTGHGGGCAAISKRKGGGRGNDDTRSASSAAAASVKDDHSAAAAAAANEKSLPPAKWRLSIVIWLSLQVTLIPWHYTVGQLLIDAGVPKEASLLIALVAIVTLISYCMMPVMDKYLFRYFLHDMAPASRSIVSEPCLTLNDGCPCFRPDEDDDGEREKNEKEMAGALRSMEIQMQRMRVEAQSVRRRIIGRLTDLERLVVEGNKTVSTSTKRSDSNVSEDAFFGPAANVQDASTKGGVTVVIVHDIEISKRGFFEQWLHVISRAAAREVEGHLGTYCVRPSSFSRKSEYIVIFQYDTEEHLREWERNSTHRRLVHLVKRYEVKERKGRRVAAVVVGQSCNSVVGILGSNTRCGSREQSRRENRGGGEEDEEVDDDAAADDVDRAESGRGLVTRQRNPRRRRRQAHPPLWKATVVTAFSLYIFIYFVGFGLIAPFTDTWGEHDIPIIMFDTFVTVISVTYVVIPLVMYVFKKWVAAPWMESENRFVAFFQRGPNI